MDNRVMALILAGILVFGGSIWWAVNASVERTRLQTEASVVKAQEHTKRAEGRHQLVDFLGLIKRRD